MAMESDEQKAEGATVVVVNPPDSDEGDTAAEVAVSVAESAVALSEQVVASAELQAAELLNQEQERISQCESRVELLALEVSNLSSAFQTQMAELRGILEGLALAAISSTPPNSSEPPTVQTEMETPVIVAEEQPKELVENTPVEVVQIRKRRFL